MNPIARRDKLKARKINYLGHTNSFPNVLTWNITNLVSSFFKLEMSMHFLKASLSGPIFKESLTIFFIYNPEYPEMTKFPSSVEPR